jgi:hypothetical protein
MGHIELGDLAQFAKGLWNGPASWVGARQFAVDEHYAGAALMGEELGKNLVFEAATAGVGKLIQVSKPFLRQAVRAPVFMFMGAGGVGGASLEAAKVLEAAGEGGALTGGATKAAAETAKDVAPDVPLLRIFPVDKMATRSGEAFAPKVGGYRGVTRAMRRLAQRLGETYEGPGRYDVGHRAPLSQTPPGQRVGLRPEPMSVNRADGAAIRKANGLRRKAGLYVR